MSKFRVVQGGTSVDLEAHTEMEARAKAVVSGRFRHDDSLVAVPYDGDRAPASTSGPGAATRTDARDRVAADPITPDAAVLRPRAGTDGGASSLRIRREASVPRLLVALVLLVALLLTVLTVGGWAIVRRVTHDGTLGDCARIGLCVETPLATVEARTGVDLPAGTERIRATASRDGSWASALVRLPEGARVPTLPSGEETAPTTRASDALQSAGATKLSGSVAGPVGVFSGTADGRTIVYLRYDATGD
ncbi:hypothetical protein Csp2054_15700 [Curtobacterium sp. 'Ferrero']|uniref:hypothetical protein n=1 Tax=Curtobacterium sp. 'Ferrero' TaxID=2033654 RepID=UPI000BC80F86|nr:hypothetical protein [Curtobacterium sp. 'Ferrero']PCN46744.1 hypothetical protein Csp2054_15700 [Curtobacterium sp. 'Ferrero']